VGRVPPLARGQQVDAAFTVEENVFQDRTTLQIILRDLLVRN
jgi:hypothetical protein